ncbi:MAG: helix-turn-helix domain-containing protein [Anaerolineae bacterium]|jgi:DNA-binding transcriptional regulator GbsR (MarR family)|nr:helix-turn-helix domain-containing protein [Anaerolineae bacterium]
MNNPASNGPHNPSLDAVSTSILQGLGQLASYFGFSKVMGQLFGALLLSPGPLSLDDLAEQLGVSKASVSTNMRTLEHMGTVHEVWVKDDRRKYYQAESDFWHIVTNMLRSRELRDVNQALRVLGDDADRLSAAIPTMNEDDRALAEFYIDRIEQLQGFFRFAQLLLLSVIEQGQNPPDVSDIKREGFD